MLRFQEGEACIKWSGKREFGHDDEYQSRKVMAMTSFPADDLVLPTIDAKILELLGGSSDAFFAFYPFRHTSISMRYLDASTQDTPYMRTRDHPTLVLLYNQ
jgi:hypothetical protein